MSVSPASIQFAYYPQGIRFKRAVHKSYKQLQKNRYKMIL